jgi:SAM-dependent methyltransferase
VSDRLAAFAAELPEKSLVLDAGAGECQYASLFKRHRYVGLDSTVGDTSWDYSRLDVIGDLEHIPLSTSVFDAVISVVVLEHTREPKRVVAEMARVTAPQGRLFLVVPDQWEVHQIPNDFFRFTRYGVEYLLHEGGFQVLKIEAVGGFGWLMSRRCINALTFFQGGLKWPIFFALAPFFGLLFPFLLYFVDALDRRRDFTLGYVCVGQRQAKVSANTFSDASVAARRSNR